MLRTITPLALILSLAPLATAHADGPITSGGDPLPPYLQNSEEIRLVLGNAEVMRKLTVYQFVESVSRYDDATGQGYVVKTATCELKVQIDYVQVEGSPIARPSLTVGECPTSGNAFTRETRFAHALVSPEECTRLHATNPEFNCAPAVTFYPDGTASIVVTDIMNAGRYTVTGRGIILTMNGPADVPERIVFRLSNGGKTLDDTSYNWTWSNP